MTEDVFWTIMFGLTATIIGLVTIWQNFQIVEIKRDSKMFDKIPFPKH